jgi:hypothetical protein
MSTVAALGPAAQVEGFVLAGVTVLDTDVDGPDGALDRLPEDAGLLLLAASATEALAPRLRERPRLLWVVLP